jgi:hypothetical protein
LLAGAAAGAFDAGAGNDLLAGGALAVGAAAGVAAVELSAEVAFFDLLFLVVAASVLVAAVPPSAVLLAAALSAAVSAVAPFFDRDFFAPAVSAPGALFAEESAVAVLLAPELSAASPVLLFLEVVFLGVAVALSGAAASVLAAVFFLDLEVVVFPESAVASALL